MEGVLMGGSFICEYYYLQSESEQKFPGKCGISRSNDPSGVARGDF